MGGRRIGFGEGDANLTYKGSRIGRGKTLRLKICLACGIPLFVSISIIASRQSLIRGCSRTTSQAHDRERRKRVRRASRSDIIARRRVALIVALDRL